MGTPSEDRLAPGQMVDHYRVRQLVGVGGMGAVYLARDTRLGRKVALKVIHPHRLGPHAVAGFLEEARVTARFSHPHIVAVYGAGEVDGRPYLALEYLEGRTLRQQLAEARLPVGRAVRVAFAVAQALAEAHDAGVIHRDLKPENIFLPRDGHVRVLDFGVARATRRDAEDPEGPVFTELAGTPLYLSPEQWRDLPGSKASDVWAFGLCLFEMLAAHHPFADAGDTNRARLRARMRAGDCELPPIPESEGVPAEVLGLLRASLQADPSLRPTARQIVQVLEGVLHGRSTPADEDEGPFRGLLPFGEEHAGSFFGREGELASFVERLRREPTLPVVGPSGAGKSSFVLAGVVPRLREQAYWQVVQMRPGRNPFGALAGKLAAKASFSTAPIAASATVDFPVEDTGNFAQADLTEEREKRSPEAIEQRLREAPAALHLVLAEMAEEQRANVLLVVDQLEELYTLVPHEAERRAFMTALCAAADDADEPIRVVFTVRDDFLGRLAEAPAAADALARVALLRPLGREALRETLVGPLRSRGYAFSPPSLADRMVAEVIDSPAALPLLQFAARLLWERRDPVARQLREEDYEAIGGVAGALARHAEEVLAGLNEPQRLTARQILLRLVTAEGTRRSVLWGEALDGIASVHGEATLERLVQSRLLAVREVDGGQREVELAHESLVRTWSRLRRWHAESREEVRVLAEVEDAARLWDRRGRRATELWGGDTLLDAERAVRSAGIGLSDRARGFLDAATDLRDHANRTRWRLLWAGGIALGAATAVSIGVAVAFSQQAERAEAARAEALVSGAQAALASGDALSARARLRSALSLGDSMPARALWARLRGAPLVWSVETPFWPHGYALAPDGVHVAIAGSDGVLRVYDLRTGSVEGFRSDTSALSTAAVSPSGSRFAGASYRGQVRVWTSADAEPLHLDGVPPDTYPYHLDFLSEEVLQLYVYWPETFETAMVRWRLDAPGAPEIHAGTTGHGRMEVSPDRRWLVSGNPRGGDVMLFDLTGDEPPRAIGKLDAADRLGRFVFSTDGARVAAVGRAVVVFDLQGSAATRFEGLPSAVRGAGWIEGDRLVALGADGGIRLWDAGTGAVLADGRLPFDGDAAVNGGALTADGRLYVNREGGMALVDLGPLAEPVERRGHEGVVSAVAVSPDGETVASGGQDTLVRLWDAATGEPIASLEGARGGVGELRWSPSGDLLAGATGANEAVIWSAAGALLATLPQDGDVKALAFAGPDEIVTAEYAGWVHRWDVSALRDDRRDDVARKGSRRLETNLFDLDVIPGGQRFVASDQYGKLHVGMLDGSGAVRVIEAHRRQAHTVIALPDGHRAVSLGFDDSARLWDLDGGALLGEVTVEGTGGMGLSADGRSLVVDSGEGAAVWDLETLATRPLPALPEGAGMAAWAPDGSAFFFGDGAGTLRRAEPALGRMEWRLEPAVDGACAAMAWPVGEVSEVAALGTVCAVRVGKAVLVEGKPLEGEWTRLQAQPDGRAVAIGEHQLRVIGRDGIAGALVPVAPGVTAVRLDGEGLWLGYADGSLARMEGGAAVPLVLVAPPARPVVAIEPGPADTLFASYEDGRVVLWDRPSGAALLERKLHGPPVALMPVPGGLSVATEVGDHALIDLSVFESPACDVLREVEAAVPTMWEGDRIVVAAGSSIRCD